MIGTKENVFSQEARNYQAVKASQTGGRYEIVQSEISSVYTFRLDKYKGNVCILVKLPEKQQPLWLEMPKSNAVDDAIIPDKINYQLILGGESLVECYLLNINTGATWILVKVGNLFSFEPFDGVLDSSGWDRANRKK